MAITETELKGATVLAAHDGKAVNTLVLLTKEGKTVEMLGYWKEIPKEGHTNGTPEKPNTDP